MLFRELDGEVGVPQEVLRCVPRREGLYTDHIGEDHEAAEQDSELESTGKRLCSLILTEEFQYIV